MTEISDLLGVVSELHLDFEAVILRGPSMVGDFDVAKIHILGVPDAEQFSVQDAITRKCIDLLEGEADSWQVFIHGQGESVATQRIRDAAEEIYRPLRKTWLSLPLPWLPCERASLDGSRLSWDLRRQVSDIELRAGLSCGYWFATEVVATLPGDVHGREWNSELLMRIPPVADFDITVVSVAGGQDGSPAGALELAS